jgi:hypothetical protein
MAAVAGVSYPSVTMVSVKGGDPPYEEFRLRLFNAVVTSVQQSGSNETPTESLSFQPTSVELTYNTQSETGMPMPVSSTVDCQRVRVKLRTDPAPLSDKGCRRSLACARRSKGIASPTGRTARRPVHITSAASLCAAQAAWHRANEARKLAVSFPR